MAILNTALAGLQDASQRFATAASRVVRATTVEANQFIEALKEAPGGNAALSGASRATPVPPGSTSTLASGNATASLLYTPSYAEDLVTIKQATAAYRANARVLRAASELDRELQYALG